VAGVQDELRQHSPVAFFQTSPDDDNQLLISPAVAILASAKVDITIARNLLLFITFPLLLCTFCFNLS
jgi:hypothetical protein